jgi:MFS transporter, OFA family, oxalate/formate antiporter
MTAVSVAIRVSRRRWLQLTLGIVCMAMIANLQYGWTLFVNPIDAKYHWGASGDTSRV